MPASGFPFSQAHESYFIVQAGGDVDECSDTPVHVAIVVDVQGYGPHAGSMFVEQNRYHGTVDGALQEAYEMHEDWMRSNYGEHLKELEQERLKVHVDEYLDAHPREGLTRAEAAEIVKDDAYQEAEEWFRETMDAVWWTMSPKEFVDAIAQWPADKSRKVVEDGVSITTAEECD